jgi:arsenate reductase (thioredoxin)
VNHKPRILFFSTHDSTRSQIAEGFLRQFAGEDFVAVSTGQSPEADPLIRDVMKEVGIDVSGQQAKQIGESFKDHFSYVVSICDATREKFPVWPFTRNIVRWSLADPELMKGSTEQQKKVLRHVRDEIGRNVRQFLAQLRNEQTAERASGFSCACREDVWLVAIPTEVVSGFSLEFGKIVLF